MRLEVPKEWEDFVRLTTIKSGGEMKPFIPYQYQILFADLMDRYSNITAIKSRQLGTTQLVVSKFLHKACLNPAYAGMCFMRNAQDASAISRRARQMLAGLELLGIKAESDNVGYLRLKDRGELHFKNSSSEGSRSYECQDFLFDESAFCENIEQIYAASSPSTALAGDAITKVIVSTPSMKSGWYWEKLNENNSDDVEEICQAVAAGELFSDGLPGWHWWVDGAGTCKVVIHFRCHPVYSQKENYLQYRQQQDGTDEETIQREYNLAFVDNAVAIFNFENVKLGAVGEYESERIRSKEIKYFIGIDTATTGNDYVVAIVLKEVRQSEYSTVAMYRKRHQPSEYHLYQIGLLIEKYKPHKIAVETTGGVGELYREQLSRQFKSYDVIGLSTNETSKKSMVALVCLALEKQILVYPPKTPLIDELLSFRRVGKKLEGVHHDDTVMALCFALEVSHFGTEEPRGVFDVFDLEEDDNLQD
jgi:hypothetical protein